MLRMWIERVLDHYPVDNINYDRNSLNSRAVEWIQISDAPLTVLLNTIRKALDAAWTSNWFWSLKGFAVQSLH